jgi:hypothetical protein
MSNNYNKNSPYIFEYNKENLLCIHNIDFNELESYKSRLLDIKVNDIKFFRDTKESFLNENDPRLVYTTDSDVNLHAQLHWGQKKLNLSEFEVMVDHCKPEEEYVIIYPGSAPGQHLTSFLKYFPNITYDLTDPRPFDKVVIDESLKENSRVRIRADKDGNQRILFTDELAETVRKDYEKINKDRKKKGLKEIKTILISDIRLPPQYKEYLKKEHHHKFNWEDPNANFTFSLLEKDFKTFIPADYVDIKKIDKVNKDYIKKFTKELYGYVSLEEHKKYSFNELVYNLFDVKEKKNGESTIKFDIKKYNSLTIENKLNIFDSVLWNISIDFDMRLQENWTKIIKPDYTLLKFRFPFNLDMDYTYINGDIYLPIYGPKHTTETRLFIDKTKHDFSDTTYNLIKYEQQMGYFNLVTRKQYYKHKYDNINGLDHCFDCYSEIKLWEKYIKNYVIKKENNSLSNTKIMSLVKDYISRSTYEILENQYHVKGKKFIRDQMNIYKYKANPQIKKMDIKKQQEKLKNFLDKNKSKK